jgi:hypothetical protein
MHYCFGFRGISCLFDNNAQVDKNNLKGLENGSKVKNRFHTGMVRELGEALANPQTQTHKRRAHHNPPPPHTHTHTQTQPER